MSLLACRLDLLYLVLGVLARILFCLLVAAGVLNFHHQHASTKSKPIHVWSTHAGALRGEVRGEGSYLRLKLLELIILLLLIVIDLLLRLVPRFLYTLRAVCNNQLLSTVPLLSAVLHSLAVGPR